MRHVLLGLLTLGALRAGLACTSFDGDDVPTDPGAEAGAPLDAAFDGGVTSPDAADVADAAESCLADVAVAGDAGTPFAFLGPTSSECLSDGLGRFVRITGPGVLSSTRRTTSSRFTLSFRVRVQSGPDGGAPDLAVARMKIGVYVGTDVASYSPRVVLQKDLVLIADTPPNGSLQSISRIADHAVWTRYTLSFDTTTGKASLASPEFMDPAVLPFTIPKDVAALEIRVGPEAPGHVVDLAEVRAGD